MTSSSITGVGTHAKPAPVVLVTGAAQRIGRVIALELADAGAHVAVHYRSSAAAAMQLVGEIRAKGGTADAFAANLADESTCRTLVPAVRAAFGRIDAVVNNASLFEYDQVADGELNRPGNRGDQLV